MLLTVLAGLTLVAVLTISVKLARGHRAMARLRDVAPPEPDDTPRVSVVIAARNEEEKLEAALRSVLDQEYPALEVVAVNDRSEDGTGAILDRLQDERPDLLRVIHVRQLPRGWLGKVHALHRGAELASGEVLLFTDADVVMRPTAVAQAVGRMTRRELDHVTVAAELLAPGPLLNLAVGTFIRGATAIGQPWKSADPASDRFAGLGAFNMVRRQAYDTAGGHRAIRMHPVDDLALGRNVKETGHRQEMLLGRGTIAVEWYPSTGELVRGLRKNAFAATGFRLSHVVIITLVALAFDVWPWAALALTGGPARWLNVAIVLTVVWSYADTAPRYGLNPWLGIAYPIGSLVVIYSGCASAVHTLLRGGITWRGTRYSLEELRADPAEPVAGDPRIGRR